jgi:hypothetical protein
MASPLHYAVLQSGTVAPTAEQLKRVFREFVHLTDADAVRLAVGARGILMRHLRRDAARALQKACAAEEVDVAVVAEDELPGLPDGHSLHRLGIWPQAFTIYDLRGRRTSIPWPQITLIAAGEVLNYEAGKPRSGRSSTAFGAPIASWRKRGEESTHRMEAEPQLLLEILANENQERYQLDAAKFTFRYVIDRPGLTLQEKFIWLAREICRQATQAMLNTGARRLMQGDETVPTFMNRQAFTDEMIWLLWRSGNAKGGRS